MASPAQSPIGSTVRRGKHRIRLLIADETPLGCQLLQKVLGSQRRIEVTGTVLSASELLVEAARTPLDAVLANADLKDGQSSGLRAIEALRTRLPNLPIVMLCDDARDDLVIDAFRAGARGILSRSDSIGVLVKCIHAVSKGQIYANSDHLQILLAALVAARPARVVSAQGLDLLGKREGEVVNLVADGLTNREIGARLGLSEHTVSNYLFRVYNKLGISSRVELVLYVMKQREQNQIAS